MTRAPGLAAFLLLWAPVAAAQSNPSHELGRNVEAVAEGRSGLEAWERGDFEACHRSFSRAESISHSPVFLLYMARCLERQHQLLEARRLYQLVANERLPEAASDAFRAATIDAARERADLESRIPSIVVSVRNASASELLVVLDGGSVTSDHLQRSWELDPGEHRLQATRSDGVKAEARFSLAEGQRLRAVELEFPSSANVAPVPPISSEPEPDSRRTTSPVRTAGYVAGGVGLVALLAGSVSGVLAAARFSDIKDNCDGNICDPDDEDAMSGVRTLATVSDVSYLIAAAGLATGAVFLWVIPDAGSKASVRVQPQRSGAVVGFSSAF